MDPTLNKDPLALLPEMSLLLGAVVTLLAGSFLPRQRQWIARLIAVAALLVGGVTAVAGLAAAAHTVYGATYAVDTATGAARLVVAAAALLVIGLGVEELDGDRRESETYALLLLSSLGAVVMAGASDLLVLAVAFLLASIPLYALIGHPRSSTAAEAAMKTYLLGALMNIVLLLGVALLHGLGGTTTYRGLATGLSGAPAAAVAVGVVGVLAGLMFKAGSVPAHFWVPDAAQGSGTAAAAFLTTVPKIGALVAAYRFLDALPGGGSGELDWPLLVAVLATLSMTLGNLAAFRQDDPRRLLGWSTVSQVGYLLLPVAAAGSSDLALPSLLLYLSGYAVTNLGAFAVTAALPQRRSLASYRGLARNRPLLAVALTVCLLSLVGTPPTAVFAGKLTTFTAAWDAGLIWLVVVAAVNTVASLFYYLRWIAPVFRSDTDADGTVRQGQAHENPELPHHTQQGHDPQEQPHMRHRHATTAALTAAVATLLIGIGAGPVSAWFEGGLIR